MTKASFERLCNQIVRPEIENKLIPLLMYRGSQNLARVHRLWNLSILAMENEVESFTEIIKIAHNPDYAHLCGPLRKMQYSTLPGFFGRMIDRPQVANNIYGLHDYMRSVKGFKYTPTRVNYVPNDKYHQERYAPWRTLLNDGAKLRREAMIRTRVEKRKEKDAIFYPLLAHDPKNPSANDVAALVRGVVPDWMDEELRSTFCHDMTIEIISGKISRGDVSDPTIFKKIVERHPFKYEGLGV